MVSKVTLLIGRPIIKEPYFGSINDLIHIKYLLSGTCLAEFGMLDKALGEFKEAEKILPKTSAGLRKDIERLEAMINESEDTMDEDEDEN